MIDKFNMKRLRNGEFIQFHKQTLAFVFDAGSLQLGINNQYNSLKEKWTSMQQLFEKQTGSDLTSEIELADLQRDKLVIGTRTYFESFTYHINPVKVAAGTLLLNSMDKYGTGISRKNYQEESAIISSIIKDWESNQHLAEAIDLLLAGEWMDALKEANEQFDTLYRRRTEDLITIPEESVTSMKTPVAEVYEKLTTHLVAHATLAQDPAPYTKLIDLLNQHIHQYRQLLLNRDHSGSLDDPTEDDAGQNDV
jgi:hypothetical protein